MGKVIKPVVQFTVSNYLLTIIKIRKCVKNQSPSYCPVSEKAATSIYKNFTCMSFDEEMAETKQFFWDCQYIHTSMYIARCQWQLAELHMFLCRASV